MLARLLKFLIFAVVVIATAWWVVSGDLGLWWPWRTAVLLLLLFPHASILALEFLLLARFGHSAPAPEPTRLQLVCAWWGEVLSGVVVFGWRQPFCSRTILDHLDSDRHVGRRGVLLIHGFVCNRGLWIPWMRKLRRYDSPYVAINLEPVFGSIDDYISIIDAAIVRLELVTKVAPLVVAHSMGGLAARAWLHAKQADHRIDGVITIGTPHQGTWLARFGLTQNGLQMGRGSRWITELAQAEPASRLARFTCFYGHCDNIVFPAAAGMLPGAENKHLSGIAHVDMVQAPEVFGALMQRCGGCAAALKAKHDETQASSS